MPSVDFILTDLINIVVFVDKFDSRQSVEN